MICVMKRVKRVKKNRRGPPPPHITSGLFGIVRDCSGLFGIVRDCSVPEPCRTIPR